MYVHTPILKSFFLQITADDLQRSRETGAFPLHTALARRLGRGVLVVMCGG